MERGQFIQFILPRGAQLVEHHTGVAEVTISNPVEDLIFQASSFQLLKLENLLR